MKDLANKKVAILGCGDIGRRVASQLDFKGAKVLAFNRTGENVSVQVQTQAVDFARSETLALLDQHFDYVIITLVPDRSFERRIDQYRAGYIRNLENILSALQSASIKRLFWVSSTSVYGQQSGEWVDESADILPVSETASCLLEAEKMIGRFNVDSTIVRFSGIYRGGRHRLITKLREGVLAASARTNYFTNRIHIEDCAQLLSFLIARDAAGEIPDSCYIGTDSEPVDYKTLVHWLSAEMKLPLNNALIADSPSGSKRLSNRKIRALGYEFVYPTFREGFRSLLASGQIR